MKAVNFKREITSSMNEAIKKVEEALKKENFGILTRIDFHKKIKEKLNKDIPPVVILGACNPSLALEAYQRNTDVTSLLPCNIVLRETTKGKISVEVAKPTALMEILEDRALVSLAQDADRRLQKVLETL